MSSSITSSPISLSSSPYPRRNSESSKSSGTLLENSPKDEKQNNQKSHSEPTTPLISVNSSQAPCGKLDIPRYFDSSENSSPHSSDRIMTVPATLPPVLGRERLFHSTASSKPRDQKGSKTPEPRLSKPTQPLVNPPGTPEESSKPQRPSRVFLLDSEKQKINLNKDVLIKILKDIKQELPPSNSKAKKINKFKVSAENKIVIFKKKLQEFIHCCVNESLQGPENIYIRTVFEVCLDVNSYLFHHAQFANYDMNSCVPLIDLLSAFPTLDSFHTFPIPNDLKIQIYENHLKQLYFFNLTTNKALPENWENVVQSAINFISDENNKNICFPLDLRGTSFKKNVTNEEDKNKSFISQTKNNQIRIKTLQYLCINIKEQSKSKDINLLPLLPNQTINFKTSDIKSYCSIIHLHLKDEVEDNQNNLEQQDKIKEFFSLINPISIQNENTLDEQPYEVFEKFIHNIQLTKTIHNLDLSNIKILLEIVEKFNQEIIKTPQNEITRAIKINKINDLLQKNLEFKNKIYEKLKKNEDIESKELLIKQNISQETEIIKNINKLNEDEITSKKNEINIKKEKLQEYQSLYNGSKEILIRAKKLFYFGSFIKSIFNKDHKNQRIQAKEIIKDKTKNLVNYEKIIHDNQQEISSLKNDLHELKNNRSQQEYIFQQFSLLENVHKIYIPNIKKSLRMIDYYKNAPENEKKDTPANAILASKYIKEIFKETVDIIKNTNFSDDTHQNKDFINILDEIFCVFLFHIYSEILLNECTFEIYGWDQKIKDYIINQGIFIQKYKTNDDPLITYPRLSFFSNHLENLYFLIKEQTSTLPENQNVEFSNALKQHLNKNIINIKEALFQKLEQSHLLTVYHVSYLVELTKKNQSVQKKLYMKDAKGNSFIFSIGVKDTQSTYQKEECTKLKQIIYEKGEIEKFLLAAESDIISTEPKLYKFNSNFYVAWCDEQKTPNNSSIQSHDKKIFIFHIELYTQDLFTDLNGQLNKNNDYCNSKDHAKSTDVTSHKLWSKYMLYFLIGPEADDDTPPPLPSAINLDSQQKLQSR